MSRGGGRGGGFGRGGGGGAQSGAMQLVSFDLLKDLNAGSLFNVNTALFPPMDVPIPRKPTPSESQYWKLQKKSLDTGKSSSFHLTAPAPEPDIKRYSDRYKVQEKKKSLKEVKTILDFFPEEIQNILEPKKAKKKRKVMSAQDEYAQLEAILNGEGEDGNDDDEDDDEKKEGGEEEGEMEEEYEDEEELFDDNDYAQNYFDNGENDGDDDDDEGAGDYY